MYELRSAASAEPGSYGTVSFWSAKGFGRIKEVDGARDVFVHVTGLRPPLKGLHPGQVVRFRMRAGRKGPDAVDVTVVTLFVAKAGGKGG